MQRSSEPACCHCTGTAEKGALDSAVREGRSYVDSQNQRDKFPCRQLNAMTSDLWRSIEHRACRSNSLDAVKISC